MGFVYVLLFVVWVLVFVFVLFSGILFSSLLFIFMYAMFSCPCVSFWSCISFTFMFLLVVSYSLFVALCMLCVFCVVVI